MHRNGDAIFQKEMLKFKLIHFHCLSGGVIKVGTRDISLQAFKEEISFPDCCLSCDRLIKR